MSTYHLDTSSEMGKVIEQKNLRIMCQIRFYFPLQVVMQQKKTALPIMLKVPLHMPSNESQIAKFQVMSFNPSL